MHLHSTCCMSGTVTKVDVALSLGTDILVGRWVAESAWGAEWGAYGGALWCNVPWPGPLNV